MLYVPHNGFDCSCINICICSRLDSGDMKQFCSLASFAILVAILIGLDAVGILVGILYCCILFSRNKMNLKSIPRAIFRLVVYGVISHLVQYPINLVLAVLGVFRSQFLNECVFWLLRIALPCLCIWVG